MGAAGEDPSGRASSSTSSRTVVSGVYEVLPFNVWPDTGRPVYFCQKTATYLFYTEVHGRDQVFRGWVIANRPAIADKKKDKESVFLGKTCIGVQMPAP